MVKSLPSFRIRPRSKRGPIQPATVGENPWRSMTRVMSWSECTTPGPWSGTSKNNIGDAGDSRGRSILGCHARESGHPVAPDYRWDSCCAHIDVPWLLDPPAPPGGGGNRRKQVG